MGDFSTAFGLCPHFGRNDTIKPNERLSDNTTTFDRNDIIKPNVHRCHFERVRCVVIVINRIKPNFHVVISSVSREIPCIRTENCRTRLPQTLARAGSAPRGGSPPPLLSFRFREIPTVVSLPRNDKLYTRERHFSRIIIINKAYVRTATVIASEGVAVAWQSHWRDAAARSAVKTVLR